MMTPEENELLCRVEGAAPMGQLMRQHWQAVCLIEEVAEADGTPIKARVLGEDLVVFRDTEGKVGVMDEYCPHRRASDRKSTRLNSSHPRLSRMPSSA